MVWALSTTFSMARKVWVWRSYKIGRGKFIPWSKFHVPDQDEVPTLKCSGASESIKVNFISIKQRRAEIAKTSQKHQGSSDEGTDDSSGESRDSTTKIFFSDFMSSVCYFEEIPASRENICPKKTLRHFEDHSFGNLHTQFGGILNDGTWWKKRFSSPTFFCNGRQHIAFLHDQKLLSNQILHNLHFIEDKESMKEHTLVRFPLM